MSSDVLIKVEGARKKFCRSLKRSLWYGMKDLAGETLGQAAGHGQLRRDEFWAVHDVSFELKRGECLGLIGRNGAGKTTLLKMLNGLIKPDAGRITLRGRVGALIALGSGFNPILTGRENIYVNGSVLGLARREIDARMDEIIDFADIGEFIDSPVQSYSSGMQVRLGFAVATALDPDILLVDEVLAVGDIGFRSKCYNRIERLKSKTTIIIVSHNRHDLVRICDRGIVMQAGHLICDTPIVDALVAYDQSFNGAGQYLHCHEGLELLHLQLEPDEIPWRGRTCLKVCVRTTREFQGVDFRVSIMDHAETCVAEWRSDHHMPALRLKAGSNEFSFELGAIQLQAGVYACNFICSQKNVAQYLILAFRHATLRISGAMVGLAHYQL